MAGLGAPAPPDDRAPAREPLPIDAPGASGAAGPGRKAGGTSERRDLGAAVCPPRPSFERAAPSDAHGDAHGDDGHADEPRDDDVPHDGEAPAEEAPDASEADGGPGDADLPSDETHGDGFAPVTQELPPRPEPSVDEDPELTLDVPLSEDAPAPQAPRHTPLPDETFPVVRPDVSEEVPTAAIGGLGASLDDLQRRPPPPAAEGVFGAEVGLAPRYRSDGIHDDDEFSESDEGATVLMRKDELEELTAGFHTDPPPSADTAVPVTDSGEDSELDWPTRPPTPPQPVDDDDDDDDDVTDASIRRPPVRPSLDTETDTDHGAAPVPFAIEPDAITTQPMQAAPPTVDPVRRAAPAIVIVFLVAFGAWLLSQVM